MAALAGVLLRLMVASVGAGYDFQSYRIVAGLVVDGQNLYSGTDRYNYGPPWALALGGLLLAARKIGPVSGIPIDLAFRYEVSALLSVADVGLAVFAFRRWGLWPAVAILLNPISIVVTGFRSQFDNLAILIALAAASRVESAPPGLTRRKTLALVLLGLSLAVKHVFFLFSFWLALLETRWRDRLAVLLLPPAVFALGFVPFLAGGREGILRNVLLYRSFANGPFFGLLVPDVLRSHLPDAALFVALLAAIGFAVRALGLGAVDALLVYSMCLVAFSPAMTVQYLAIPVVATIVFVNPPAILYHAWGGALLLSLTYPRLRPGFVERLLHAQAPGLRDYEPFTILLLAALSWGAVSRIRSGRRAGGIPTA